MEQLMDIFGLVDKELMLKITMILGSFRLFMKPAISFWNHKVAPLVEVRPKEKLMQHPLYIVVTYMIDWGFSIKLPQSKALKK